MTGLNRPACLRIRSICVGLRLSRPSNCKTFAFATFRLYFMSVTYCTGCTFSNFYSVNCPHAVRIPVLATLNWWKVFLCSTSRARQLDDKQSTSLRKGSLRAYISVSSASGRVSASTIPVCNADFFFSNEAFSPTMRLLSSVEQSGLAQVEKHHFEKLFLGLQSQVQYLGYSWVMKEMISRLIVNSDNYLSYLAVNCHNFRTLTWMLDWILFNLEVWPFDLDTREMTCLVKIRPWTK